MAAVVLDVAALRLLSAPTGRPLPDVGLAGGAIAVCAACACAFCSVMHPLSLSWRKAALGGFGGHNTLFAVRDRC